MKDNVIREKAYSFALAIIGFCRELRQIREFELSHQLFKSGTSIGANVEESQAAQSRADFLSKMCIASKEARETLYWLSLIRDDPYFVQLPSAPLLSDCSEIVRILTSIVKSTGDS